MKRLHLEKQSHDQKMHKMAKSVALTRMLYDVPRMARSVGIYQTVPQEQSDLGLHCLPRSICPSTLNFYCMLVWRSILICLSIGKPKSNKFSICSKCKIDYF